MKVLVTGGAGFVGSHVVDALIAEGVDVRVLDRASSAWVDDRAEVVHGDIRDPAVVDVAVDGADAVCHQAAMVGLGVDFGDAGDYVSTNDVGTAVLLDALWRRRFTGRFVLASSMVVYGDGLARCAEHGTFSPRPRSVADLRLGQFDVRCPVPGCQRTGTCERVTEDAASDPRNVYAATKLHQEHLCSAWSRESGASVVALRYHNVYGPRMPRDTPYAGVVSIFASAIGCGRAPEVYEDGGQLRDFVHVRDVARANALALLGDRVQAGPYNVASGTPRTVADVATALWRAAGAQGPPPEISGRWRPGDVRHVVASPNKARVVLGFTPEVSFEEGMAEFAAQEAALAR